MLADNADGNLTSKQQEFAKTIYAAGSDLLSLINDILDMAKIESGTMAIEVGDLRVRRAPRATSSGPSARWPRPRAWRWASSWTPACRRSISTDARSGSSRCSGTCCRTPSSSPRSGRGRPADRSWPTAAGRPTTPCSAAPAGSWRSRVIDTGIGIAADKLKIIFEPFQQADTGTSRKYGGTGLGLSISREIARLLGGEIRVRSTLGEGSTFTLYLPLAYQPPAHRTPAASPGEAGTIAGRRPLGPRLRPPAEAGPAAGARPSRRWTSAATATTSSPATA